MKYQEAKSDSTGEVVSILRFNDDGSISSIPLDPANSDYQRYLRWLENPNEVEHSTEIPPQAALSTPNVQVVL